ncbi:C2 domain protein [Toxoplasma gondii GAB2-2007-GAL-DOM2]|uniref:C2 domain protein n=1 Tax=Toxoplasma gondii GAB2-2007-GAL-DOM2 TaxID=1130820 RepID=A0A086K4F7_TOXGO|nr:C2 domain protein [Toxoplasma gondii GAB2-2007-GAL-DOM2]
MLFVFLASDSDRVYLILRIKDVDQIVTPDNRPVVDSYVEVSFDGTSRRTRTVRNTLNPVWDDEVTIPLRLPAFRDITESDVTRKGKVWLDVWGTGPGYVDHLGGCSFSLYEIFFNEKHNKRNLTAMQRIDLEANTRQSYETRVFSTSRRLAFIHKADRPSTIQFEAWTCPDILEVSGIDKLPEPERITTTSNFPRALRNTYERLKRMYAEVIEKKGLVNPDTGVGPPRFFDVEFLDQRKETHYAPTMVTRIRPPFGVDSESSVFHYCRCVPFAVKRENLVFTPEFAVQIRSGNAMDHSILMTSLLLGLPAFAFVCVGERQRNTGRGQAPGTEKKASQQSRRDGEKHAAEERREQERPGQAGREDEQKEEDEGEDEREKTKTREKERGGNKEERKKAKTRTVWRCGKRKMRTNQMENDVEEARLAADNRGAQHVP